MADALTFGIMSCCAPFYAHRFRACRALLTLATSPSVNIIRLHAIDEIADGTPTNSAGYRAANIRLTARFRHGVVAHDDDHLIFRPLKRLF